jgi:hypothetical protein
MIKECRCHIWFYHPEKSAMAELSINLGHCILQNYDSILAKKYGCMERIIREATERDKAPSQ